MIHAGALYPRRSGASDRDRHYIEKDNREAAKRVIQSIRKALDLLRDNPNMGRPGHLEGTRELVIPRLPHYAAYRVKESAVEVFAVIHTARQWPEKSE